MAVLLFFCLGARLGGEAAHEWTGLVFALLVALHVWINRQWVRGLFLLFRDLFRGRSALRRSVGLGVNLGLAILFLLLVWGGLMNSRSVLAFLDLEGSLRYRDIHTLASWWLLVLGGVHAGLHWPRIAGWLGSVRQARVRPSGSEARPNRPNPADRADGSDGAGDDRGAAADALPEPGPARPAAGIASRLLWLAMVLGGVWASCDRELGSKLFLGHGFDFWDPARPAVLFYLSMAAIFGLYAWAAHHIMRLASRLRPGAGCGSTPQPASGRDEPGSGPDP